MKIKKKSPDWWVFFSVMALVFIGIIMVFSSSQYLAQYKHDDAFYFLKRQCINVLFGSIAMFFAYRFNYRLHKPFAWYYYAGTVLLLLLVLFSSGGDEAGGAVRWLDLGFIRFQPSELAKITMVILLSAFLSDKQKKIKTFKDGFIEPLLLILFTAGLVFAQKDLGTTVLIVGVGLVMMFCAGVRMPYLLGFASVGLVGGVGLIAMAPYRMKRIIAYLDPWSDPLDGGMQACQSLMAIGNGGLTGVGLGAGGSKWGYLPAGHTDFIYSVLAEELGFIGAVLVIILFVILVWRGLTIAVNMPETFGALLALGVTGMIGLQAFVNLGVVTGLLPITGITLPFISYGGTSMIISMASAGLLLNLSRYSEIKR
ncbi:MAG: putative lipid II flippase FtsW [Clostridiales bacterium]